MWCLKEQEGRCIYILPERKITFGKLSDIKIEGDTTVSRCHATIFLDPCEESELQNTCVIYDLSKYGTYILRDGEKKKLPKNEKFVLKADDKVQFGLKQSIFIVTYHSLVVVPSSLSKEEMDKLRNIMKHLGGRLLENWNNSCTYLTGPKKFLFTIKLAYALASAKIIVTIAYWDAVMKAVEEMKELPKINDFLSTVEEEWLRAHAEQLLPKEERRMLFHGLCFVHFCARQYATYAPIITAAGGKSCVYPTKKPLTPRDLTAKNAIVIQPTNDSSQFTVQAIATDYPVIHNKLSALKRRMIGDSEIPLAILYCSIEKYCNPIFNFGILLKSSTQTFSPSDFAIVEDTQDMPSTSNKRKIESKEQQRIIPETLDSQYGSDTSKKARLCPESEERDISENSKSESDIVSSRNKQPQIIPETCDSMNKSIASNSFSRNIIKSTRIIPESCDRSSIDNLSAEHEQRVKDLSREDTTESRQQKEVILEKENNLSLKKHNLLFQKHDPLLEDNNTMFEKKKMTFKQKNLISEKNNPLDKDCLAGQNDDDDESKNSKGLRITSLEKLSNSSKGNVCDMDQTTENTLEKNLFRVEMSLDSQLRQRNKRDEEVSIINVEKEEKRKENKSREMGVKEVGIKERDENREKKSWKRRTICNKQYLGCEFTDKILRKDAPCGKRFVKASVKVPARRLKLDDFVL